MSSRKVLAWEEPPPSRGLGRTSTWSTVAQQLRERPGVWALIDEGGTTTSSANHISQGKIEDFRPAGSFEATGRRMPDTKPPLLRVYARYVGEPAEVRTLRAETLRRGADRRSAEFVCCDIYERLSSEESKDPAGVGVFDFSQHGGCYWMAASAAFDRAEADRIERGETPSG